MHDNVRSKRMPLVALAYLLFVPARLINAQIPDLLITPLDPWPQKLYVGVEVAPVPRVRVTTPDSAPVQDILVRLTVDAIGELQHSEVKTDSSGVAVFNGFNLIAPTGDDVSLFIQVGAQLERRSVKILPGMPARLTLVHQPSRAIKNDSVLPVQPVARLTDMYGNPIPHVPITASLKAVPEVQKRRSKRCDKSPTGGALAGTTEVSTDDDGLAEFTDLAVVASCGNYVIDFLVHSRSGDTLATKSDTLIYDQDFSLNRSYVVASAIKSISGQKPDNEFFDVRFRFRLSSRWFVLASSDVALTAREVVVRDTSQALVDSLEAQARRLTEAGLSLNMRLLVFRDDVTSAPQRSTYLGLQAKIFNTLTYYGPQFGLVELGGSIFHGSSLSFSYLRPIITETVIIDEQRFTNQKQNLFMEFFLRSSKIPFFQTLTLRGGILFPLRRAGAQSRIAVAVPIGTIEIF